MGGMVCIKISGIQNVYMLIEGMHMSPTQWTTGLILKLLETTHGQWLYQNVHVHDVIAGTRAILRKEQLQHQKQHYVRYYLDIVSNCLEMYDLTA